MTTIAASGINSELILVTDDDGIEYSIPKAYASFVDTSNSLVERIDFIYGMKDISLIFLNSGAKDTFMTSMRALY